MDGQNGLSPMSIEEDYMDVNSKTSLQGRKKQNGVFLSYPWLIVLCLGAVALSTVVGLIVHFAHPEKECICPTPESPVDPSTTPSTPATTTPQPTSEDYLWDLCVNISVARNECFPCFLSTEPPVSSTPSPIINYRLPRNMEAVHYSIRLRPDIYGNNPDNFSFEGEVSIQMRCAEATSYIIVHKRQIDVTDGTVQVVESGGANIEVRDTNFDEETEFFWVRLARTLGVGEVVNVSMQYTAALNKDMAGLFWTDYYEEGERKFMVGTQFQSTDARKAYPCLDEPNFKARFTIALEHLPGFVALSNMPNSSTEALPDGWVRTNFEETSVVMPTYLLAFAIADYTFEETTANGPNAMTPKYIRNWGSHQDVANGDMAWATEVTPPIFDYLENLYQFEFPLTKTDQIVIPDFRSFAMENWGLITYRPFRLLYNSSYSTTYAKEQVAATIAHELVHMWLGNVVTCDWWGELWVQEGMARYYQHEAEMDAVPAYDSEDIFISQVLYGALAADSTGSSPPLTDRSANTPAEVAGMFSTISYDKGACLLRMVKNVMGPNMYNLGMQEFIEKMKYDNAIEDDLFASWEARYTPTAGAPGLSEILKPWTNQMGYPVITISRTGNNDEVLVSQKMFLLDSEAPIIERYPSRYGYTWHVPITYATSSISNASDWLNREANKTIAVAGLTNTDWIVGNLQHHNFYRVNYDSFGWNAIITQLVENDHNAIDRVNRASLIQDVFSLARSGDLDQLTGLELMAYLENEEQYLPFYTLDTVLSYLEGMIYDYPEYTNFRAFMRTILEPNYNRLGWNVDDNNEDMGTLYLRSLVLEHACNYGLQDCVDESLRLFSAWRQTPTDLTIIHPDIRAAVYCTAARESSDNWDFLLQHYLVEIEETETSVTRDSLLCSRQPWELQRLFSMAIGNELKDRDISSVLSNLARNRNAQAFIWENLNTMWSTPLPNRQGILSALTEYYNTNEQYEQIQSFIMGNADDLSSQSEAILRPIRANMRWQERNKEQVTEWLKNIA